MNSQAKRKNRKRVRRMNAVMRNQRWGEGD
jgi:hypothetical protein